MDCAEANRDLTRTRSNFQTRSGIGNDVVFDVSSVYVLIIIIKFKKIYINIRNILFKI